MIGFIVMVAAVAAVFVGMAKVVPTIEVRNWGAAFGAALVFGLANGLLGWLLKLFVKAVLFLPAMLSFGLAFVLVPFVVNAVLLKITDYVIEEPFEIKGVGALMALSAAVTAATALTHWLF